MLLAAIVLWLAPPAVLGGLIVVVARGRRFRPPMGNAVATGVAAAAMVLVCFDLSGLAALGPGGDRPRDDFLYAVPAFATFTAAFAWALGWACASLYLGLRECVAGRRHQARCPGPMQLALALVTLLGLIVFYREQARTLAAELTRDQRPNAAEADGAF